MMKCCLCLLLWFFSCISVFGGEHRSLPDGQFPSDERLAEPRNLNGYFPFKPISDLADWPQRREQIRRRILLSQGLWPMPTKTDLRAVIHGRVDREDYVVDRVIFESIPGHYLTGSLYRPKGKQGPFPAVLSPHGHWRNGRFYQASESQVRADLASGAERFENAARFPIQARAVQLARMGGIVFVYDMTGNADSVQLGHRPDRWAHLDRKSDWGFFAAQAELRLQNMMGLQTWNSIRAVDFLLQLPEVDSSRIGVTGASGGGTQSMILAAVDQRVTAAMPCVMVSTAMQGGCTCENAPYLRIDQGNVDIAAAIAPRPLGLTAADDWTIELESKGFPDLERLYRDLGHADRLTAAFHTHFKHNYNHVNRAVMYGFFNRHFQLGFDEPVLERDFEPLTRAEATVFDADHPAPAGDQVGDAHEVDLLRRVTAESERRIRALIPDDADELKAFDEVVGAAWRIILRRRWNEVADVSFRATSSTQMDPFRLRLGLIDHHDEQLPVAEALPANAVQSGTLVWLSDSGKESLFDEQGFTPFLSDAVKAGYRVVGVDLLGQGEFVREGDAVTAQPMWYQRSGDAGWERFSGYTYGYNDPLFVRRVHDVLTVLRYVNASGDGPVHLIGFGKQAGPIAAAARMLAGQAIERTWIDAKGFRFESLTKQDHPMFVPGAVKYLGVEGLLACGMPGSVEVAGMPESRLLERVAAAHGASDAVHWHQSHQALQTAIRQRLDLSNE
jgi:dienelactone hydrolase